MRRLVRLFLGLLAIVSTMWSWPAIAKDGPCSNRILAMSYNIRLDTPTDGENSWSHRREFLIGQIQLLRPALLGMQEVLPNQRSDIQEMLDRYQLVGGGRDDGKLAGEASPIAINRDLFRIDSSGTFWLSPTPHLPSLGWDAAYPRIATWARVRFRQNGTKLLVINTHWDHEGRQSRIESGKQIAQWIVSNRLRNESVVLLGDFNTDSTDPAITTMIETAKLSSGIDPFYSGPPADRPSSFNDFETLPQPGKIIDQIFVSDDIAVERAMVVAQHHNGRVASDHFPVVALLEIPMGVDKQVCK